MIDRNCHHNKFVVGIAIEKLLGASLTGFNSRSGELLTLRLKYATEAHKHQATPQQKSIIAYITMR